MVEKKLVQAHVLVVPYPAQGHINPLMHLSKQLASHGVIVTFANAQFNHERLLQSQAAAGIPLPHSQYGENTLDIRLVGIPDGLGYDEYVANFNVLKHLQSLIAIEPLLVKLVEEQHPPVTCIIADLFVMCTPAVSKKFGIPHVAFWTQSAASYAAANLITQNYASLREELYPEELHGALDEGKLINGIPGCPPLKLKEVFTFLQPLDPSDFMFNYFTRNFENVLDSAYVLMNTFEELEGDSLQSITKPPKLVIGPVLPCDYLFSSKGSTREVEARGNGDALNADKTKPNNMKLGTSMWVEDEGGCMPWLNLQKPKSVLYVSFGSIAIMCAQQIREFANGLEASGWPFLMVLRPKLTTGNGAASFLRRFVDRMSGCGRASFVQWAPQLEVLAHPAVGGFLTHCGWNSTLESICVGVPMLCWPYFADQMLDCRCVVDTWKVGLDFVAEDVEDEEDEDQTCKSSNGYGSESSHNHKRSSRFSHVAKVSSVVSRGEIEQKVKLIMDPSLSKEMRERATILREGAKRAYNGRAHHDIKTLLAFLFGQQSSY